MKTKAQLIQHLMTVVFGKYSNRETRLADFGNILGYRVESTTLLTELELSDLIHCYTTGEMPNPTTYAYFDKNNTQHRKILSLALQMGWRNAEQPHLANLHVLGCWIKSYRCPIAGKRLQQMTTKELSKVIFALEEIIKKKYKR
ncbi:hypothetical protein QP547_00880 [Weeksella virosa]|uniref:hypothetical protein n=1 Tax=Weeksella virosa TaxID=1014 RepID=UPI0025557321|nr:hypothetical protein [Weeksella virosa]MDK7674364.1 hypothetical protein [Weeksella virosa]